MGRVMTRRGAAVGSMGSDTIVELHVTLNVKRREASSSAAPRSTSTSVRVGAACGYSVSSITVSDADAKAKVGASLREMKSKTTSRYVGESSVFG